MIGFIATTGTLTSVGPLHLGHVLIDTFHPRLIARQISLLISLDLPTIPPPTTALPFRYDRFITLLHRRSLPRLSPGQTDEVGGMPSRGQGFAHS